MLGTSTGVQGKHENLPMKKLYQNRVCCKPEASLGPMAGSEEPTASATKFEEAFTKNAEGELACLSEKASTGPLHTLVAWREALGDN